MFIGGHFVADQDGSSNSVRSLSAGEFELETGCDRLGTFEPKVVLKRQLIITEELEGNNRSLKKSGVKISADL